MNSKALVFLAMLLASILLIAADVAPKDLDEKFDNKDDKLETNGVDESKYPYYAGWGYGGPWRRARGYGGWHVGWGGGYGGPWRRGWGGAWRGGHGGWRRGWGGGWPSEYCETHSDIEPHT